MTLERDAASMEPNDGRDPRRSGLFREGSWVASGQVVSAAGRLVGTRILTGVVTPAVFGEINLLQGLATLGNNLFFAPIVMASARYYADANRDGKVGLFRRLVLAMLGKISVVFALVLVLGGAAWIRITGARISVAAFVAVALFFVLDNRKAFEWNLLNVARRQAAFSMWNATDAWAKPLAAVAAALMVAPSATWVLLGYAAGTLVVQGVFRPFRVRGDVPASVEPSDPWAASIRSQILRYGAPLVPVAMLGWIGTFGDRYVLAGLAGASATGVYTAAYGLGSQPYIMLAAIVAATLKPLLFDAVARGDTARERRVFTVWLVVLAGASAAGVAAVAWLDEVLVRLFLGPAFRGAAPLLVWIAAAYALQGIQQVFEVLIYAHGTTKRLVALQAVTSVSSLVFYFGLIPRWGAKGAAIGTLLTLAVSCITCVGLSGAFGLSRRGSGPGRGEN